MDTRTLGKIVIALGVLITVMGGALVAFGKIPLLNRLGKLPGDIHIQNGNFSVFIPITTSILLSVLLTLILLVIRIINRQ